ncbi:Holliday junction branch migration protein RuvA [Clostridium sp. OM02-18AC]|uniref:Holliday junction branch migration protein RuvA n=1 Tax=Clostridium sp. OM02-18AC TaxID=2292311 RepID=UPI000E4D92BB|nr:Holliday junction branch migration protein RuvA [Clostridium sp. OM02-18AC]RHV66500.1 Holliday junction branch migration protein RuvA [Clostridium sp. OM02-18AC]
MFSYIKGTLEEYWEDTVVIESGGIGWNIHVPLSVLDRLPHVGEQMKVYTSFQVKEDSMTLYGFLSRQDLKMFNQLLGVNGIGPKAALGILSSLTPDDLRMAIIAEDAKAIAKAPGIGPKTAKRVILDLKDKISMDDVLPLQFAGGPAEANVAAAASGVDGAGKEAIEALVALGYSPTEATKAVRQVEIKEGMNAEAVLKASLKFLAF